MPCVTPQDVSIQNRLIKQHSIKIFVYNKQVTDSLTNSFLSKAKAEKIPVVGVYETMPTGDSYQSWMLTSINSCPSSISGHGRNIWMPAPTTGCRKR